MSRYMSVKKHVSFLPQGKKEVKQIMKSETKHALIDLKELLDQERNEKMTGLRFVYIKEQNLLKQDLKSDLKAIRTTYKGKYEVEKQRAVNNEKQDE